MIIINIVLMVCDFIYPQPVCGLPWGNKHTLSFQPPTPRPLVQVHSSVSLYLAEKV